MGILTKMLGTKIFLLLSLSVLGYSMPQPEMRIIIHLHYDDFQPGPAHGPETDSDFRGGLPVGRRRFEVGSDYSDDVDDTVDEEIDVGEDEEEEDEEEEDEEEEDGSDDQSGETKIMEVGDDYHDHWDPQPYQGYYDDGAERGGYGHHWS